jgi:uncharacterized C2H2 Zn-finger protein
MGECACERCGASFDTDYDLIYHIQTTHTPPLREVVARVSEV